MLVCFIYRKMLLPEFGWNLRMENIAENIINIVKAWVYKIGRNMVK